MSARTLVLLPDAAPHTGVGHYVRSSALGAAAAARGWGVVVVLQPDTVPWVAEDVARRGWRRVAHDRDARSLSHLVAQTGDRSQVALVVDSYRVSSQWLADAQAEVPACMLVIDDLADRELHGDIVLNQNVGAEDLPMRTGPQTELLLGPRYALLRPEFAAKRPAALASVESVPDSPRTVLVLMGGTDPTKSSLAVALACKDAFPEAVVTAVSPTIAGPSPEAVHVVSRIDDVATAMAAADLVVTAAGSTLWEVCCLARPAAALRVAENQRDVYGRLTTAGVVHGLGGVPVDRRALAERLRALTAETGALRRLAAAGASLVDGLGAQRVVDKLEEHMEGRIS